MSCFISPTNSSVSGLSHLFFSSPLLLQGPELLVDCRVYDYSLDLWGVGCMLAGMLFKRDDPFFKGRDNDDQLLKIVKVLGTEALFDYLDKYNLVMNDECVRLVGHKRKGISRKAWQSFVTKECADTATPEGMDLLDKLLRYDHMERLTAKEAQAHPFFDAVRPI